MKIKHNKKRNSAFVYEALIREATVAILKKDEPRRDKVIKIIRKHFTDDSYLRRDLECHRSLYENQGNSLGLSEKILIEAKAAKRLIDPSGLFKEQSALIKDINTDLDSDVFNNFVPNYRSLATIAQIFSIKTSPKDQVILENEISRNMSARVPTESENEDEIDAVVVRTFIEKFNTKYSECLLDEQKDLLTHYISSFTDNALELKIYLNEEITRLKTSLKDSLNTTEIATDQNMTIKTNEIIDKLGRFTSATVNEKTLLTVLKTQSLVKEISKDGSID
jgi:hypothetical protein